MATFNEECFFCELYSCRKKKEKLQNSYRPRIMTIISCSQQLGDSYHRQLQTLLTSDSENPSIKVHKSCVSRYTSSTNVKAHIAHTRKLESDDEDDERSTPKRLRSDSGDQFDFRKHCLFCLKVTVCLLTSEYDNKTPMHRRKRAFLIRSSTKADGQEYKQYILDVCQRRNDNLGQIVRERVLTAVADLHAADARCHESCRASFISARNVRFSGGTGTSTSEDTPFEDLCGMMQEDRQKVWSSTELFDCYVDGGGCSMSRKTLFKRLSEYHGENVVILSSPGFANIMGFRSHLAKSLHLVTNNKDDLEYCVDRVASVIAKECKALKRKKEFYHINIDKDLARDSVGDTTASLLSKISPNFNYESLSMILVGNIITGVVCSQSTDLQVALGVLMRRNKSLISELAKYSVCCSYDEVRLFKYSAAVHVSQDLGEVGLFGGRSLTHCICDNFDAEISSPNCKICVHCLAIIMADVRLPQTGPGIQTRAQRKTIKRQPLHEKSKPVEYDVQQEVYNGPKNPAMPDELALRTVPTLSFLATRIITSHRAQDNDFTFLQAMHKETDCPEYNGYNTRLCREAGLCPLPKTSVVFLPLIDRPPAQHNTIKTAIEKGLSLSKASGNDVLIFTADQQLYKVAIDILFHQPTYFASIIPILGGMHMLMNFIHAVAIIMNGSGIKEVLASTFGSVDKMLTGKKYPQNFRAFRMLAEELLRDIVQAEGATSFDELTAILEDKSASSRTAKLWIDIFVKAVFIMMNFSRAAHECDWILHLCASESMLPYFRSAGCHNYARYAMFYVHHMSNLPPASMEKLKKEAFVRHIPGIYNSIWTDMFIETTYMRMGHGPAGMAGVATDYNQMMKWALSYALCGEMSQHVKSMSNSHQNAVHVKHKEEAAGRIKVDHDDRESLRNTLDVCINPLDVSSHPDGALMNIVNGQVAHPDVNADKAIILGQQAIGEFRNSWPGGFYSSLGKLVTTMDVHKKHVMVGKERVYDQELIYARVIGLLASSRDIKLEDVLAYELAAYPPSMFNSDGEMKICKSKSVLKQKLQITTSDRTCIAPEVLIYDVSALVWTIPWTIDRLKVYINNFKALIFEALQSADVRLIFDRYFPNSIKNFTRMQRDKSASRVYKLRLDMHAPPKQVVLTNTKNKMQLNELLVQSLLDPDFVNRATHKHSLMIAGVKDVPVEITKGTRIDRQDLCSTHEEADILITQHAISCSSSGKIVRVICDDTDVFVLLCHYYHSQCLNDSENPMYMSSPIKERAVIDIRATVREHSGMAGDLLAVHGLSGADTVASLHGIGKAGVLKLYEKGDFSLSLIGDVNADMKSVIDQATKFICAAYGKVTESCSSMTECRVKAWQTKTGKTGATSVKLSSLPPTNASFEENVKRCHLQVAHWKASLKQSPPLQMDPTSFGWEVDHQGILVPRTVPHGTLSAPSNVLQLIRCNCKTSNCRTSACSCSKLGCTVFCVCEGGDDCLNPLTKSHHDLEETGSITSEDDGED